MTMIIVRAQIALAEAAHGCCTAVEKTFVDRNFSGFAGAAGCQRMDDAGTRTKRDRRLLDPSLETNLDGLICNKARCKWLWSKRKIVADANRAKDAIDVTDMDE